MKSFSFYKLPVILQCLGGALVLAPQSRAQSEIAPNHFDGRDSWAAAASAKTLAQRAKAQSTLATPALEPGAAREVVTLRRADATATKRRKPAAPKSNN
jgi:hypothetical protein